MRIRIDLVGQVFERWTVIERAENGTRGRTRFLCQCVCGTERVVLSVTLRNGTSKSCGCIAAEKAGINNVIDRTGNIYNKLTVIRRVDERTENNLVQWLCKCECGGEKIVAGKYLASGAIKSCGCLANKLPKGESAFNVKYGKHKYTTNKRELECNLSSDQFRDITSQNCHYCGSTPSQVTKNQNNNGDYISNGVDRVNNDRGYYVDNVVPCCAPCNYAKRNMTYNEFKAHIARIYHHMKLH